MALWGSDKPFLTPLQGQIPAWIHNADLMLFYYTPSLMLLLGAFVLIVYDINLRQRGNTAHFWTNIEKGCGARVSSKADCLERLVSILGDFSG